MKGAVEVDSINNIMVCVTQQKTCERLIKKGEALRNKLKGNLYVIHAVNDGVKFLGNQHDGEALDYLYEISKNANAEMRVLRSKDVVETLVDFANEKEIGSIILGESPATNNEKDIISKLKDKLPGKLFYIVPASQLS